ncbi:MAG TPA: MbtH domain protein [Thermoanaerobaculia bacterium]|nr:MbtH domain protein [Thermoanaerobaculia bacterium]
MNELVQKLTKEQPVEASLRPEPTAEELQAAIERRYVHIKFTETRGGTELGVPLDEAASDWSGADFAAGTGEVKVVGNLILDYVRVRLHATVDVATLKGTGRLEILGEVEPGDVTVEPAAARQPN